MNLSISCEISITCCHIQATVQRHDLVRKRDVLRRRSTSLIGIRYRDTSLAKLRSRGRIDCHFILSGEKIISIFSGGFDPEYHNLELLVLRLSYILRHKLRKTEYLRVWDTQTRHGEIGCNRNARDHLDFVPYNVFKRTRR